MAILLRVSGLQLLIVVLSKNSAEFGLTIAAIPVVLVLLVGCGIAVKREIKWCVLWVNSLSFSDMHYLSRLMVFSLFLMLASETYCECLVYLTCCSDSALVQLVCDLDRLSLLPNLIRPSLQIGSLL
jgi:hypothetical protein